MYTDDTRKELQDIICGNVVERSGGSLESARNYLCAGFGTSTEVKKDFENQSRIKEEQKKQLTAFADKHNLWIENIADNRYLAEGGEAKVYFATDNKSVLKLNDGIYYATWLDFFNSVSIHNLLFDKTAYNLLGFLKTCDHFYAVLGQPFIIGKSPVSMNDVKTFLEYNGFENTKRNDYYNREIGLILEDIHDENVLISDNTLFFIDTVFYIHKPKI